MKSFVYAICALVVSTCLISNAYAATEVKIAVVDLQRALEQSVKGQAAQTEYQNDVKKAQEKIDGQKKDFEKEQTEFQKQAASLSSEARASKEESLIKAKKELERSFQDTQESLRRKNNQLVSGLIKSLREIVAKLGKSGGYSIVLEKGNQVILHADEQLDITDAVVKEFDKTKK
jgi:outer membrane protein